MNLGSIFIVRPVMTTLVMVAILFFGLISYRNLPISDLPNVDYPTLQVTSSLPGASAETMASAVSMPLEKQFATIAGLTQMTSTSTLGQSLITLQFDQARNMDGAALDVQAAITAASKQMPPQMTIPPTFAKVNPASQPVIYLAVSSDTLPLHEVDYYAETLIAQRVSRVGGVAQVQVNGSQVYAVRVQVNPQRLASYNLGIDDVMNAVVNANQNQPTGTIWGKHQAFTIQSTNGQLLKAEDYQPVIVSYINGAPVRVKDVGRAIDSVQNDKQGGWHNGKPAVILAVLKQPGANTIKVVDDIKALMPTFRSLTPETVKLDVLYDQSQTIRASIDDVQFTLLLTVGLVIFVIFIFLGNLSATLIPSLALPISVVGTFAAMKLLGFSLDNLSLMALSLSVGFVVDDAIVMLENIVRHMEMGEPPMEAALNGAREIGFTILSMTLSLVAVFIPVLLMPGIVGRLFNEFAVTISIAILISGFISISLTPMLCSRFLKPHNAGHDGKPRGLGARMTAAADRGFSVALDFYRHTLNMALAAKPVVMVLFVLMVLGTGLLFAIIPKGFMPAEDTGQIVCMTEAGQGTSYDKMVRLHTQLTQIIAQNKNVKSYMSSLGVGNGSPNIALNQGRILIVLKPKEERRAGVADVIKELQGPLNSVPDINCYLQNPPTIAIGGQVTKSLYQFTLSSPDRTALYKAAREFIDLVRGVPGITDVASDMQIDNPEVHLQVDRDKCSRLGITMQQVEDALDSAYAQRQISTMYTSTNQYWVIIEVEPRFYRDPAVLKTLYVRAAGNTLVPLDTICQINNGVGPLLVNHLGQFGSVTISFNLQPGASLGDAVARVKQLAAEHVPKSVTTGFQGTASSFEDSFANLWVLLLIAVLVIYIVLGILYESFVHPLTILSGLPSAGLGALLVLLLCHKDLDIYGFLGLIMLIGIVKKNAIMMIDFAVEAERERNLAAEKAIYEACLTRFRPIMMTTMAALMGAVPIAIGFGAGSESRQPLGLTVVGGLLVSQLVTLYITPVFYIYLDEIQRKLQRRGG
ncbi:MAG: efflux RND transporter permease subunit [Candidatus Obscuribacterales bacterium]|nr:efflux RND transporter permease subunit [Candidatus Obscuribacterales bacterium]